MRTISGSLVRLVLLKVPASTAEGAAKGTPEGGGEEARAWDRDVGQEQHAATDTLTHRHRGSTRTPEDMCDGRPAQKMMPTTGRKAVSSPSPRARTLKEAIAAAGRHPVPCSFALSLIYLMVVEYTLTMVAPSSPPFDLGFHLTGPLNRFLAERPALNSALAAINTVFVAMQGVYILGITMLLEGRGRPAICSMFLFTCRGIMGCATQLPLPRDYLGSGADFPVANVSFFLFFSGHVAAAVISSLDMRRVGRRRMAALFDALNVLQVLRLLATRGHYTIDLATGLGAGLLFDMIAGKYEESRAASVADDAKDVPKRACQSCCACTCHG